MHEKPPAVQCPPPAPIRNAVPAGDVRGRKPYTYLEYFQVTCLEGFEREGPAVLICGDMGRWIAGAQNPNDARCVGECGRAFRLQFRSAAITCRRTDETLRSKTRSILLAAGQIYLHVSKCLVLRQRGLYFRKPI